MLFQKWTYNKAGLGISLPNIEKVENGVFDLALSFFLSYISIFWNNIRYP